MVYIILRCPFSIHCEENCLIAKLLSNKKKKLKYFFLLKKVSQYDFYYFTISLSFPLKSKFCLIAKPFSSRKKIKYFSYQQKIKNLNSIELGKNILSQC